MARLLWDQRPVLKAAAIDSPRPQRQQRAGDWRTAPPAKLWPVGECHAPHLLQPDCLGLLDRRVYGEDHVCTGAASHLELTVMPKCDLGRDSPASDSSLWQEGQLCGT